MEVRGDRSHELGLLFLLTNTVDVEWSKEPPKAVRKDEAPPRLLERRSLFSSKPKTAMPASISAPRASVLHTKLELSGVEAVHEATRRSSQFNFSDT